MQLKTHALVAKSLGLSYTLPVHSEVFHATLETDMWEAAKEEFIRHRRNREIVNVESEVLETFVSEQADYIGVHVVGSSKLKKIQKITVYYTEIEYAARVVVEIPERDVFNLIMSGDYGLVTELDMNNKPYQLLERYSKIKEK